jgi:hypothetical protein
MQADVRETRREEASVHLAQMPRNARMPSLAAQEVARPRIVGEGQRVP